MSYDKWKTQTPEEYNGETEKEFNVTIDAYTDIERFEKIWKSKHCARDVKVYHDDERVSFLIDYATELWVDPWDTPSDIRDRLYDDIRDWVRLLGDDIIEWEIKEWREL